VKSRNNVYQLYNTSPVSEKPKQCLSTIQHLDTTSAQPRVVWRVTEERFSGK